MPQPPDWNKYLDAGAEFVAMTRAQARQRAKVLVGQGQLAQEQVQGFVDELVDESKRRTDAMLDVVRKEIQRQVKTLGIATKEDLARLEARIAKAPGAKSTSSSSKSTPKPAATKRAGTKPAAKKAAGKKSTKPKSAGKKSTKQTAKKSSKPAKKKSGRTASKAAAS